MLHGHVSLQQLSPGHKIERNYRPGIINAPIERAKNIPRVEALKKVENENRNKRPVFVITYEVGKAPPERPIISGSGSYTENISLFVEHHIKNLSNIHPTYLQDSPDF